MRIEVLLIILGMAAVTFFTRFGTFALFRQTGIPGWLGRRLKHIPTAILTALIMPALLLPEGHLDISLHNPYLLAGVVAALIAYKSQNIVATLGLGMTTMFVLRLFS